MKFPSLALVASFLIPLARADERPNVIFIVTDDMGYADIACQGAKDIATPNLDRMAAEGTRFTDFYVAQAVCTASRAGFLSGCYPNRVGLQGALNHTSRDGIHPDEWLMPEMFKERGYATSGMGKWHLGTVASLGPMRNGFDEWFGGIDGIASRHGGRVEQLPLALFDLIADPGESNNVAAEHPNVVARLSKLAAPVREALGDSLTATAGKEVRAAGLEP